MLKTTTFRFPLMAAAALLAIGMASGPASAAAEDTPEDVINGAIAELKTGLNGKREVYADDRAALYQFIDGLLAPRFDRNYAGALVLARHWRKADKEQKRRFIEAFYSALLQRYADGVLEFREDRVEVLPARGDADGKRATVRTLVTLDNGEQTPVNYGLVNRGEDGWKVFDVTIEGISYIRNFRTEIDEEVRKTSLDAVIARLESEVVATAE